MKLDMSIHLKVIVIDSKNNPYKLAYEQLTIKSNTTFLTLD
jgi:hypothetical protein